MYRNRGFTAIELMVVIAIVAILAALALPSFAQLIRKWQMTQVENGLIDAIYLARSEAVKWGGSVRLAKIPNTGTCSGTAQDWSCGWQVTLVATATRPLPSGFVNPIKLVKANEKIDVMTKSLTVLNLNQWGNPNAGFGINLQHRGDNSMLRCVNLSSGGRVEVIDGICP
ncbi:GspH/FimT family pseudopilin [Comamonas serinivorans]|nr:GspH/FimT family pseudopilin [Comamonas serinivorans]